MAEIVRSITVKIEVDTNKDTYTTNLELGEFDDDETKEEFAQRVLKSLEEDLDIDLSL